MADPVRAYVKDGKAALLSPTTGELEYIPVGEATSALERGYVPQTGAEVWQREQEAKFDAPVTAGLLGAARGATFGLSDVAARGLGVDAETLAGYSSYNPVSSTVGEIGGVIGTSFIPGGPLLRAGKAAETAGILGAKALGKAATSTTGRLASGVARSVSEGALIGAGHGLTKSAMDRDIDGAEVVKNILGSAGEGAAFSAVLPVAGMAIGGAAKKAKHYLFPDVTGLRELKKTKAVLDEQLLEVQTSPSLSEAARSSVVIDLQREVEQLGKDIVKKHIQVNDAIGRRVMGTALGLGAFGGGPAGMVAGFAVSAPAWAVFKRAALPTIDRVTKPYRAVASELMAPIVNSAKAKLDEALVAAGKSRAAQRVGEAVIGGESSKASKVARDSVEAAKKAGKRIDDELSIAFAMEKAELGGAVLADLFAKVGGSVYSPMTIAGEAISHGVKHAVLGKVAELAEPLARPAGMAAKALYDSPHVPVYSDEQKYDLANAIIASEPGELERTAGALATFVSGNPQMATQAEKRLGETYNYLRSKAPRLVEDVKGGVRANKQDLEAWGNRLSAVASPEKIIHDFSNNALRPETVEAVRTIYPELVEEMRKEVVRQIELARATGSKFSDEQKRMMGMIIGRPKRVDKQALMALQNNYTREQPRSGNRRSVNIAEGHQTTLQRAQGD